MQVVSCSCFVDNFLLKFYVLNCNATSVIIYYNCYYDRLYFTNFYVINVFVLDDKYSVTLCITVWTCFRYCETPCNDILEVFLNTIDVWEVLRNTKYGGNVPATTSGVAKRQVYGNTKRFETSVFGQRSSVSKHVVFQNTRCFQTLKVVAGTFPPLLVFWNTNFLQCNYSAKTQDARIIAVDYRCDETMKVHRLAIKH